MTIEKSKIKREEWGEQPLRMKCYVGECLCYGEKKGDKSKNNCVNDDNPCHNSNACWWEE
jgi:hypothetical protein